MILKHEQYHCIKVQNLLRALHFFNPQCFQTQQTKICNAIVNWNPCHIQTDSMMLTNNTIIFLRRYRLTFYFTRIPNVRL